MAKKKASEPPVPDPAPPAPKRARRGSKPKKAGASRAESNAVTIRMYKQGLGDCFLLTFPSRDGGRPVRVLIDCGVLQRTPREAEKLISVAEDLLETTRGPSGKGEIDLLIATHEHWDHIAGFSHAAEIFRERFEIGRVWLSWAENLNDRLSQQLFNDLSRKKQKAAAAFAMIEQMEVPRRLGAAIEQDDASARRISEDLDTSKALLGFLGMADEPPPARGKKAAAPKRKRFTLGETMDWLRSQVADGDFCEPGECRPLPKNPDIKVYILGPPRDESLIRTLVSRDEPDFAPAAAQFTFLGALEQRESGGDDISSPFEPKYRVPIDQAARLPFFQTYYGFEEDELNSDDSAWRRIDDEWLVAGLTQLSLQIDKQVNNTSLAVAFELPDGRTLIFPGDAQFGNWFSWDALAFKDTARKSLAIKTEELLRRAVFYKVGHHGSHNATRFESLHRMTSGQLVAMIPTDEEFASLQSPTGSWIMPALKLARDLDRLSSSRIIRADRSEPETKAQPADHPSASIWEAYTARVEFSTKPLLADEPQGPRLWVEYKIPLSDS